MELELSPPPSRSGGAAHYVGRARRWDILLEEVLPGAPQQWSESVLDRYTRHTVCELIEDTCRVLGLMRERITRCGSARQLGHEERAYLFETLGWVLGYWNGSVSFELAAGLYGINGRFMQEEIAEGFADEIALLDDMLARRVLLTLH